MQTLNKISSVSRDFSLSESNKTYSVPHSSKKLALLDTLIGIFLYVIRMGYKFN